MANVDKIFDSNDVKWLSQKKLPKLIYDFIEGATGREVAVKQNLKSFDEIKLLPRSLRDVSKRSLATEFLGQKFDQPFGISPMGMCNLTCPKADLIMAKAAKERNFPHGISTATSTRLEEIHNISDKNAWFQLYVFAGAKSGLDLAKKAQMAGYKTLILTVDVPQGSRRMRELRNGFQVPFKMGLSQILDLSSHPLWSLKTLIAGIPKPVLINESEDRFDRKALRIGATWEFLDQLRVIWKGKIIIKGILSVDEAKRARSAGMDAIWVSNHGGRQLDAAPAAIEVLPIIRDALGDEFPIAFDSGIRDGSDVVKALAKGADFTFLGRPILHSLAAAGGPGLEKILSIFYEDINVVMAQIGINQIDEINSSVLSGGQG